ncbi:nuclear transcription factor, X-box binding stc [Lycorma delicatula]|uniref:nuclear transcription factor, X-box binding stc n=1 Tax=Lycorma delicatula TaxID=130591 RepID=UPI003F517B8C
MSNWGRPYFNSQNFCYRPNGPPDHHRWQHFSQSANNSPMSVYPQQSGTNEFYNSSHSRGPPGFQNADFNNTTRPAVSSSSLYNPAPGNINSDIWAKAANSTLVPTAGEFVPSASYHQSSNNLEHQAGSRGEPRSSNSSTNIYNGERRFQDIHSTSWSDSSGSHFQNNSRNGNNYHNSNQNGYPEQRNYSKNSYSKEYNQKGAKSGWDKYNRNSNRQTGYGRSYGRGPGPGSGNTASGSGVGSGPSLDEMKSEGRRKLLQEVASLLQPTTTDPPVSAVPTNVSQSSKGSLSQEVDTKKPNSYSGSSNIRPFIDYKKNRMSDNRSDRGRENWSSTYENRVFTNSNVVHNSSDKRDKQRDGTDISHDDNTVSQRERLTEQLERGTLECLVCYDRVRQMDAVWNCSNCYHVLHLRCIIKWANSSRSDSGWRCPACQNVSKLTPRNYYCFCGKVTDPDWNRNDTPHSCGEVCNKPKPNPSLYFKCNHRCTVLCHPGPCPPCITMIQRNCGCGRTSQMVQCGQNPHTISCGEVCCRQLNCGEHFCNEICHLGDCKPCPAKISQVCYCGEIIREVPCDKKNIKVKNFECGNQCPKKLDCGHHPCLKKCHQGACGPCPLDAAVVTHCPCGKMPLDSNTVRKSCLDPVPTCGEVCGKSLLCGRLDSPHTCKSSCHESACPPCELTTLVRCRCGHMDQEIPCKDLQTKGYDARCQKKCTKKRSCGKHKCNQLCCIEVDHVCPIPCNHILSCGQHRCEELCHKGHCKPCWRTSFEELYCECRSSVLYPPVACGTKPPECSKPCTRSHNCDHPALHNCHSEPDCPPCTVLTAKYCHGMHELRKTVPCHLEEFSCGLPCGKELPCGRHKCILPCHKGECLKSGQSCVQPCTKTRSLCGHPCGASCHEDECPDTPCKETVKVTCECGNRSTTRPCCENNKEYQRIATSLLASKMADVQLGRSIDLQDMQGARNKMSLKTLECNDECRIIERNRRLSIGLQIRNPDLSAKLTPRYSDFMRNWAKKDPKFCQAIHDKLTELVQLAKQSKQKSRSFSFETMNREKRQFVHEYCEHFGCESVAYDAEPKRNVVATAQRDKAWLPSYSLLEVLQREMGQRKVPVPTLNSAKKPPSKPVVTGGLRSNQNYALASTVLGSTSSSQTQVTNNSNNSNKIDYFNYNG